MSSWAANTQYVRLVQQHSASLMRLALLLCRNRQDAEDAVQDALISVAMAWPRVRTETAVAYTRRAVIHQITDQHRRRRDVLTDAVPERPTDDLNLLRYEDDRAFVEHIRNLPAQQRAVVVLRYYADYSDSDIGKLLGCSVQTVRSQASRALAKLRLEQLATTKKET